MNGVDTPREQSLVAYLLLHGDAPQSRHHLAFLFWPDSTEVQALTNLRHILHHLRLPDLLAEAVRQAVHAWEGGDVATAHTHLVHSLDLAQEMGYL